MAHSYDQTLIQRMGFADPDRRSPAHDDACIQIATEPERFVRTVKELRFLRNGRCELEVPLQKGEGKYATTVGFIDAMVMYETGNEDYSINRLMHYCNMGWSHDECTKRRIIRAEHVEKAARLGKEIHDYVNSHSVPNWLRSQLIKSVDDPHVGCEDPTPCSGPAALNWHASSALIEVKTRVENLGFLLRQMNLYREYKKDHGRDRYGSTIAISDYVIWSLDPADSKYTKLLAQQGYTLIAGQLP